MSNPASLIETQWLGQTAYICWRHNSESCQTMVAGEVEAEGKVVCGLVILFGGIKSGFGNCNAIAYL